VDLVHVEDRRTFVQVLQNSRPHEPTRSVSVRLLDARNRPVDTHLYCTCLSDEDSDPHYLIAVCESQRTCRDLPPVSMLTRMERGLAALDDSDDDMSADESCSGLSELTTTSEVEESGAAVAGPSQLSVSFDVLSTGYCISQYSSNFPSFAGPSEPGGNLVEWVADRADFEQKIQKIVHDVLAEVYPADSTIPLGKLALTPPSAEQLGISYLGDAVLHINAMTRNEGEGRGFDNDSLIVHLNLQDVVILTSRGRGSEGLGPGNGGYCEILLGLRSPRPVPSAKASHSGRATEATTSCYQGSEHGTGGLSLSL